MEDLQKEQLQKAESHKGEGNELFKVGKYEEAIKQYTEALVFDVEDKNKAIYYSNRAYAQIKLENFGLAIADAEEAIKLNPTYPKPYYRKADANIALNKYVVAKECLRKVVFDFKVNDSDAQQKYKFVVKILKERAFMAAIEREDATDSFDPSEIIVEASYAGPRLEKDTPITYDWCVKLMEFLKGEKRVHKKYVCLLIQELAAYYKEQPSFIDIDIPADQEFTVVGDTHGQFYDLLSIFSLNGYPSDTNPYLFNGDFVDRGSFSVEILIALMAWSAYSHKCVYMSRGNHEAKNMNKLYGFEGEVTHKYDTKTYDLFSDLFCKLPLGHILNNKVLVLHGGLPSYDGVKLAELKKIDRFREPPDTGLMTDVLWADPIKENGRQPSKRGISMGFGPDISKKFLDDNNLELLVRSHEMKDNGYEEDHNGRVITIFSAPNYCDQMKNKGAIIRFKGANMTPKFTTFEAVQHPKVPPMAYARSFLPFL